MERIYIIVENDNGIITMDKQYYKDIDRAKEVFQNKVSKVIKSVYGEIYHIETHTDMYFVMKNDHNDIITKMIMPFELSE